MNIAFIGKKQAGKDTAAKVLINKYGYARLGFADCLKWELWALLHNKPLDYLDNNWFSFFETKKNDPEVRQLLQSFGNVKRKYVDPDYWLNRVVEDLAECSEESNILIVITDCRYLNEVVKLKELGFKTVRISRNTESDDTHISETELDSYECDYTIYNVSSIKELHRNVEGIIGYPTEGAVNAMSLAEFTDYFYKAMGSPANPKNKKAGK